MKYLLTALAAALCVACLVVVSCGELDGNPHDAKSSNYAGGGSGDGDGDGDSTSTPAIRQFTVFFNTNGGTPAIIASAAVDSGAALGEKYPADPAKSGHTFGGWFDNAALYTASTVIIKDVMLTAKWDDDGSGDGDSTSTPAIRQFTVFFNTNGGTPAIIASASVDSGTVLGDKYPIDPARPGHTFGGWYDDAARYTGATVITKDVMLAARWDVIPVKQFTVSFDTDGGTPSAIEPAIIDSGAALGSQFPAAPTKAGHTFGGWLDGVELYSASTIITGGVTLTAMWSEDDKGGEDLYYTLAVGVGAAGGGTVSRDPDRATYIAGTAVTVKAIPMAGYTFMGWVGASTSTNDEITVTMGGNITLTANFHQIIYYTVGVNINPVGGGTVEREPNLLNYTAGTRVTLTAIPAAGYWFGGWGGALNETDSVLTVTVSSDLTLTANFRQLYTLAANVAPAAGGTVSREPNRAGYLPGTPVTVTAVPADGYRFTGWLGASTSEPSATVTVNSDTMLTANFERITHSLTVTAAPSAGGTVRVNNIIPAAPTAHAHGVPVTISASAGNGYAFMYWGVIDGQADIAGSGDSVTAVTLRSSATVTAYFTRVLVDPRDEKRYRTVEIGGKTWMAENLNHTTEYSFCYDDDESNCEKFGRLYHWGGAAGICPEGWSLPEAEHWEELFSAVGGEEAAATKLRSKTGWNYNGSGTDEFGFSALPGGYCLFDGTCNGIGSYGGWWSATLGSRYNAYYWYTYSGDSDIYMPDYYTEHRRSVRCVED